MRKPVPPPEDTVFDCQPVYEHASSARWKGRANVDIRLLYDNRPLLENGGIPVSMDTKLANIDFSLYPYDHVQWRLTLSALHKSLQIDTVAQLCERIHRYEHPGKRLGQFEAVACIRNMGAARLPPIYLIAEHVLRHMICKDYAPALERQRAEKKDEAPSVWQRVAMKAVVSEPSRT